MADDVANTSVAESSSNNRTLRTYLLIGAGCVGVVAVGLCVLLALGVPMGRSFIDNFDWEQSEALLDVVSGDLLGTLEASMGEEFDEELFLDLESTLDATVPEDFDGDSPPAFPDMVFQGIQFSYPQAEDYAALPEVLPAELEVEWYNQPERIVFFLNNYPFLDTFHEPRIIVMSTEALLAVNSSLEPSLNELEAMLQSRPSDVEPVPYIMPSFNAAQIITTHVDYLDFVNGSGVRFVTQYGQAAWPINNRDIFYAFQGLTDDGAYLLNAVLPVTHPSLPADGDSFIGDDFDAFLDQYEAYLASTKQSLGSQAPESFNPGLDALDSMMGSFQIEAP